MTIVRPFARPIARPVARAVGRASGAAFPPILIDATPVTSAVQFAAYGFTGSLSGGDGGPYTIPTDDLPADIEAAMTGDDTFEVTGNFAAAGNPNLSITFEDGSGNTATLEWSVAVEAWVMADLFASGETGFWYDGSRNDAMRQANDGFVAVTTGGQSVGLDLSVERWGGENFTTVMAGQPELNSNPGNPFTVTTGYSAPIGGVLSVVDGKLRLTADTTAAFKYIARAFTAVVGKSYRVRWRGVSTAAASTGTFGNWAGVSASPVVSMGSLATHETVVTATSTTLNMIFYIRTGNNAVVIGDYIELEFLEIQEVPSVPSLQASAGSRPTWDGARALLFAAGQFINVQSPNLGSDATLAYVTKGGEPVILTGQTIGAGVFDIGPGRTLDVSSLAMIVALDRALTANETTAVTAKLAEAA